ncbi:MAG: hypothetical protein JSV80_01900, partial [Acidobacteriota bacterium]
MIFPRVAVIFVFVSAWASPSVAADRASAVAVEDAGLQDLAWLAGHWTQEQNGRTVHELWTVPTSNRMLGLNWTIEREQSIGFEFLRIERGEQGQVAYVAAPGGRSATTSFGLVERGPRRVAFENPD